MQAAAESFAMTVDWDAHACLFRFDEADQTCIAKGALHAMVGIALTVAQGLDALAIACDDGAMFCGPEIGYIGMLADRPS